MKHISIYAIILTLLIITSCSKRFLETPITTDITRQSYITDLTTCEEYLNGVYVLLAENGYYGYLVLYADVVADNMKPVSGNSTFLGQFTWQQEASEDTRSQNMNAYWLYCCRIIRGCNYVIEKADALRDADYLKADHLKGQALAIRALMHHSLVNVFAQPFGFTADASHQGIPYIISPDWTDPMTQESVANNYTNIIADLESAIKLISPAVKNKEFISTSAARALLARVLLFKKDYLNAKDLAVSLAKEIPIMTAENYPGKLFTEQETEAFFQIRPSLSSNGYTTLLPSYYLRKSITFVATDNIAQLLQENEHDIRKNWIKTENGIHYVIKFPTSVVPGWSGDPSLSYFYSVIRSSELYLTAAECLAHLGKNDSAYIYLDAIRRRADPTAEPSTATGAALQAFIATERRKEFCFENFRMFDLLRTGKGVTRTDADINPSLKTLPYPSPKAISPLPQFDVQYYNLNQNQTY